MNARENWSLNETLIKRIDAFQQWCYRRITKINWKDKRVSDEQVLRQNGRREATFREKYCETKIGKCWTCVERLKVVLMLYWLQKGSLIILMGREQETDPEERGQMTLYSGCRRQS